MVAAILWMGTYSISNGHNRMIDPDDIPFREATIFGCGAPVGFCSTFTAPK